MRWESCVPQLPVRDVPASQRWYGNVLGLAANWLWENNFGSVGRDHAELFLYESDDPLPVYVSLFVDDVDNVYADCRERGAEVAGELELKPWDVREFTLRDPDGHLLRIGQAVADPVPRPEFSFPGEAR